MTFKIIHVTQNVGRYGNINMYAKKEYFRGEWTGEHQKSTGKKNLLKQKKVSTSLSLIIFINFIH